MSDVTDATSRVLVAAAWRATLGSLFLAWLHGRRMFSNEAFRDTVLLFVVDVGVDYASGHTIPSVGAAVNQLEKTRESTTDTPAAPTQGSEPTAAPETTSSAHHRLLQETDAALTLGF